MVVCEEGAGFVLFITSVVEFWERGGRTGTSHSDPSASCSRLSGGTLAQCVCVWGGGGPSRAPSH